MRFADFHCDTLLKLIADKTEFAGPNEAGHLDLSRLLATNFAFQCFAAFFYPDLGPERALRHTLFLLNAAKERIFSNPQVIWVKNAADLDKAQPGRLMAMLSIEGADFLGSDLFLLDLVYNMGVRLITLTWNGRNSIADGIGVGKNCGGLTELGIRAVQTMEELGILVDVSHLAEKGFWDLASIAGKPFVASHSNAQAVCPHPRNLTDRQILEIDRRGGLIGMNLCPDFIAERREDQDLKMLVRHMSHIAEIASADLLCLGCDLDGIGELPLHMNDVTDIVQLPQIMADAGFNSEEIQNICGGNLVRFLKTALE